MSAVVKCLVADDQAMVREGFGALLAAQPGLAVVGQAADGAEAVRRVAEFGPDVVLMDVRMPVMDGLEATRQILAAPLMANRPRVLMLTTFDLDEYVYDALSCGASGFLLKDATGEELVRAVRAVAAGDALLAPSVTLRLIADFARQRSARRANPVTLDPLTPGSGRCCGLWPGASPTPRFCDALFVAPQTTKTHIGHILTKLDLRDPRRQSSWPTSRAWSSRGTDVQP